MQPLFWRTKSTDPRVIPTAGVAVTDAAHDTRKPNMPLTPARSTRSRIDFVSDLSPEEVASIVADPGVEVLQTSEPVENSTWDLLNSELFLARPDIELRVYGFYNAECDLSFVQRLANVRRFAADCLMAASGIEHLASLARLETLSIGIFNLSSFDFLAEIPADSLHSLSLGATESKRPRLGHLRRFTNLRTLSIEGPRKEIEVMATLPLLEDLTLRSIGSVGLAFLQNLRNLWSLDIKLGGTRDLSGLADMEQIKYLELWQIKGLENIEVISTMVGLQFLFLEALRNVTRLPDLSRLTHLRRIMLRTMKGLTDVSALASAPALSEFLLSGGESLDPEDLAPLFQVPSLRSASAYFANSKKDRAFKETAAERHVEEFRHSRFQFS